MRTSISFITLGCAKNEVDTEQMCSLLGSGEFSIVEPELAELIVINTCAFIEDATQESIDTILDVAELCPGAKIVVAGCLATRYGEDILTEMPEISAILPVAEETKLPDVLSNLPAPKPLTKQVLREAQERSDLPESVAFNKANSATQAISKYVKISDGCDRFCSYCTIPMIRGRYISTPLTEIASMVERHIKGGAKEITFIGQDTGIWGSDLSEKPNLANLLATFAEKYPSVWFRFLYLQPEGISDELINVVKTHDNICNYFDIPIQHVSAHILEQMNRRGSAEEYLSVFKRIRANIPNVTLRTTLMVGFPGETERDFGELLDFIAVAKPDRVAVFSYSREDGTKAYELEGQISDEVKLSRLQMIKDELDNMASAKNKTLLGDVFQCLVIDKQDGALVSDSFALIARAQFQAPDIDGEIEFYGDSSLIGSFLDIRLTGSFGYDFEGQAIV